MIAKELFTTLAKGFEAGMKKAAVEMIITAEKTLPGATGKEKRKFVVDRLDAMLTLPWFLEALDGPALGVLVDLICDKLNLLTDHEKILVSAEEEKAAVIIEATDEELTAEGTIDDKLNALYKKYKV